MNHNATYLLDTDTCIYLLNGVPQVKAHVAAVGVETLAVATVTQAELYFGAYHSQRVDENLARLDCEADVVHGHRRPVSFRQIGYLNHQLTPCGIIIKLILCRCGPAVPKKVGGPDLRNGGR